MHLMHEIKKGREFYFIDVCRIFMAIWVIATHTNPFINVNSEAAHIIAGIFMGMTNPFFFIASGFFLFFKMDGEYQKNNERMKSYLVKIIRLYIAWTLISFPLTIYGYVISGESIFHCILSYVKYFFFVGKLYNSYHLWYLLALIYSVILIKFLINKNVSVTHIFIISLIIYVFSQIMLQLTTDIDSFSGINYKILYIYKFIFNRGNIFMGAVYVSFGMLLANKKVYLDKWLCLIIFISVNIILMISDNWGSAYFQLIEDACFFMFALGIKLPKWKYYNKCRDISSFMYFSHLIFFSFYSILLIDEPNKFGVDSFIVTLLLSGIFAILVTWLKNKNGFKWLKIIV